jgi:hypothetical protein
MVLAVLWDLAVKWVLGVKWVPEVKVALLETILLRRDSTALDLLRV